MQEYLCGKNEKKISTFAFVIFLVLISFLTLFGFSPILHSIVASAIYVTILVGFLLSFSALKQVGISNFAGKAFLYLGSTSLLSLLNILIIDFERYIQIDNQYLLTINEAIWIIQAILMVLGLSFLLTTYKLSFPRHIALEIILTFSTTILVISFFAGWPQILNALLITAGIMAVRIAGKKAHLGIVYLSSGLILLAFSNILFLYRTWSEIAYFGDTSDIALLISWIIIVIGIYCAKKHHV